MAHLLTEADNNWINTATTDELKNLRKTALINLIEMNGIKYDAGLGKSYIPEKNYYIRVNIKGVNDNINEVYEKAANFVALGGGVGGLAGAGVRWGLRKMFSDKRESKEVSEVTEDLEASLKLFTDYSSTRKDIISFWNAQSMNVLGLAAAIFNREMHHWNGSNIKPQQALLGALGQIDDFPESEYRKLFYLSIHPVPLDILEKVRQEIVESKIIGISDAVITRCRSSPAGYGDVHAAAQAATDLIGEAFFNGFGNNIKKSVNDLMLANNDLVTNAGKFHVFAANYGLKREILDKIVIKRAMVCCTAYIFVHIKGSLAQSAAIKKFRNANSRSVQKWIVAFEAELQKEGQSLIELSAD